MEDLVTICIPTYNGEAWIAETIRSALAQTYRTTEILVIDDSSTDNTTRIVRSIHDGRIHLEINRRRLGLVRNWNRSIQLSKGEFIKPLFQDDVLYPTCVQSLHALLRTNGDAGLVFALRDMLVKGPDGNWVAKPSRIRSHFRRLQEINRGEPMLSRWLRNGYRENWIGEPSCVMLRRSCLEELGLFNTKMWMCADFELWMRIMHRYDIGFVNEPLSAFRVHPMSATIVGTNLNMHWLDMVWLVEGLVASGLEHHYPELRRLRIRELFYGMNYEIWRIRRRYRMYPLSMSRSLLDYVAYRLSLLFGFHPDVHEALTAIRER